MEGIILFADDHVFQSARSEFLLFQKFNMEGKFSILPINNLLMLEKTVSSVSTYRALILDWNFKRDKDEDGLQIPDETPYEFLKNTNIYSLIYIYSQAPIPPDQKEELEGLYPNKIFFAEKISTNAIDVEHKKISDGIEHFETNNKHLVTPFIWSQAINTSVQSIFNELENADPNWIKEIYSTANIDGAEPNAEVINVFHNLLNELIIQNSKLIKSIGESAVLADVPVADKDESLARLYNRIYFTHLLKEAPIMTGDIFKFTDDEYAILITPECDVISKKESQLEFLKFNKQSFDLFLEKKMTFKKDQFDEAVKKDKRFKDLTKQFNNASQSFHILISFPFETEVYNQSAYIDFESAFVVKSKQEYENKRSEYKLNSPYIFQLRQRYLSYIGRVGVPAVPPSLRAYNLK